MRANGRKRVHILDRVRRDGLLQVGACLLGVIAVLYAFACAPQPGQVATPTFNPEGGSFTDSVDVTIACGTEGATVRYTTDGSDPDGSSTECTGAIHLTSTTMLKARAFMAGMADSEVASATYTITAAAAPPPGTVATPTFSPEGGTYGDWVDVTITCATGTATIRYTTDGSDPDETSTTYTGPIQLTETTTLKARGFKAGLSSSPVAEATYAIKRAKLVASDGAGGDEFGYSVSVSGDVAVVGACLDDDNGSDSGSAYVYRWNGTSWAQEPNKLLASDGAAGDDFGCSVSVSGDVAVVGAYLDDDNGSHSGSAYVYRWNGTSWAQEPNKLVASDGAWGDRFGWSVSVSGNVVVVGAYDDDDNGSYSGSAYVFRWNGTSWAQEPNKLLPSDGAGGDRFGWSVSVSGDVAVVGAYGDDDNGTDTGSAYVFRWNGTSWVQEAKLLASDGAEFDDFGRSVSVSGDVAVVGAPYADENGSDSGSAYIFARNQGGPDNWGQVTELLPSDGAADDYFGWSVSLSGDVALVGAYMDDDKGSESGSAYVFRWNGTSWVEQPKLLASDGAADDEFGLSVSVSGNVAVVGAYYDDDKGTDSGSAYVFGVLP